MALPLVGTPQANAVANGADITLTFDVAPATGDVVIVFGGHGNSSDANPFGINTADYTPIALIDSTGAKFGVWYKEMGATPDTDVVCEGGGNAAHSSGYGCYVLDGTLIDAAIFDTSPIFVSSGQQAAAVPAAPGIVTNTDGAWVIGHAYLSAVDTSRGTPSGYTNIHGGSFNDGDDFSFAAAYLETGTAGSYTPGAWSTWTSGISGGITIAIKPLAPVTITGTGALSRRIAATMSGTAVLKYVGTGALSKTLGVTMSGTASLKYVATGALSRRIDAMMSGTAVLKYVATGALGTTIGATMAGTATMTPDGGGEPDPITGTGALSRRIAASISGTAVLTFVSSGALSTSLTATMAGTATMTPDPPPGPISGTGALSRRIAASMSGEASSGVAVRRARGRIFVNAEDEKEDSPERPILAPAVAKGIQQVTGVPHFIPLEIDSRKLKTVVSAINRHQNKASRTISIPDDIDDEEALIQILMML